MIAAKFGKRDVLEVLKPLKVVLSGRRAMLRLVRCEVTVTDGKVTFSVPGIENALFCETKGVGRFTAPYWYLLDIFKNHKGSEITLIIRPNEVTAGIVSFTANTTYFKDDTILRTIQLPINFTDGDILGIFKDEGYTLQELEFNKILPQIREAKAQLDGCIVKAFEHLKNYGISKEDVEKMVYGKIDPHRRIRDRLGA